MLRLIGLAIEGQPVEFDIAEIENVFPSDGVLYVGDGVSQTAVKIESVEAFAQPPAGPCPDERHMYYSGFLDYSFCPYCGQRVRGE